MNKEDRQQIIITFNYTYILYYTHSDYGWRGKCDNAKIERDGKPDMEKPRGEHVKHFLSQKRPQKVVDFYIWYE